MMNDNFKKQIHEHLDRCLVEFEHRRLPMDLFDLQVIAYQCDEEGEKQTEVVTKVGTEILQYQEQAVSEESYVRVETWINGDLFPEKRLEFET